jgi:Domain of unknown function (DUF4907)
MASFLRKWGLALLMVAAIVFFVGFGIHRHKQFEKTHVLIELKAIPVSGGWGYDILMDGHPYIHQPFIPDIQGTHGFRTQEEALAVGGKVKDRLVANQLPIISIEEMRQLGVQLPDSSTGKK